MEFAYDNLVRIDAYESQQVYRDYLGKNKVIIAFSNGETVLMFANGRIIAVSQDLEIPVPEFLSVDCGNIMLVYCDRNGEVTLHLDPTTEIQLSFRNPCDGTEVCRVVGMSKLDYPLF